MSCYKRINRKFQSMELSYLKYYFLRIFKIVFKYINKVSACNNNG